MNRKEAGVEAFPAEALEQQSLRIPASIDSPFIKKPRH